MISPPSSRASWPLSIEPLGYLYVKVVLAYARAEFLPSDLTVPQWHNYMYSGRIRLLYIY